MMTKNVSELKTEEARKFTPVLNLGAGGQPVKGMWNVDYLPGTGVDEVVDLNGPWPWPDHSIVGIHTSHCVEHLQDVVHFMREANRVLMVGGWMEIKVPFGWDSAAMSDPTHVRPMYPGTFMAFSLNTVSNVDPRRFNLQQHHSRWDFGFEIRAISYTFRDWVKKLPFWRLYCFPLATVLINVISQFEVKFEKVK